jgi:nucleotide-binding universal stress UspA family protein
MYKKILVPLDGSDLAEAVLPHVESLAKANDAQVVIVRVALNPATEFAMTDPSIAGRMVETLESNAKEYLSEVCKRLMGQGLKVSMQIAEGPIADSILQVAADEKIDLIAMSTHGRSGVARWLIGSIADKVVRGANIPVLLIRPPNMKAEKES